MSFDEVPNGSSAESPWGNPSLFPRLSNKQKFGAEICISLFIGLKNFEKIYSPDYIFLKFFGRLFHPSHRKIREIYLLVRLKHCAMTRGRGGPSSHRATIPLLSRAYRVEHVFQVRENKKPHSGILGAKYCIAPEYRKSRKFLARLIG